MLLRIEGFDLPGHPDLHVGVQRRRDLHDPRPADAPSATWEVEVTPARKETGWDLRGPFVQGRPGARFVYLSWGRFDAAGGFTGVRRAKLMFDGVPADVLDAAVAGGALVARVGLTDAKGGPLCAAVRPPLVTWSA